MARSFVYLCAPLCPAAPLLRPRFLKRAPAPVSRDRCPVVAPVPGVAVPARGVSRYFGAGGRRSQGGGYI